MLTENIKHIKDVLVLEKQQKKKQLKKYTTYKPRVLGEIRIQNLSSFCQKVKGVSIKLIMGRVLPSSIGRGRKKLLLFCV